ncbi:MAG: hypothetical protein AAFN77_09445 [Planctomycetota bacterium]
MKTLTYAIAVVALFTLSAEAQMKGIQSSWPSPNQQLGRPIMNSTMEYFPMQQRQYYTPLQTPHWALPQHPVFVTPNQFRGYDPYTGMPITQNLQVENTYFDPNRNLMRNNGTERFVRRNVYDARGRIVGFEQGNVWRNTITGAEHHDLKVITQQNGKIHEQKRVGF